MYFNIHNSTHHNVWTGQFERAVATANIPSPSIAHDDKLKCNIYRAIAMYNVVFIKLVKNISLSIECKRFQLSVEDSLISDSKNAHDL